MAKSTIRQDDAAELRLRVPRATVEAIAFCSAQLSVLPSKFVDLLIWEGLARLAEESPDDAPDEAVEQRRPRPRARFAVMVRPIAVGPLLGAGVLHG